MLLKRPQMMFLLNGLLRGHKTLLCCLYILLFSNIHMEEKNTNTNTDANTIEGSGSTDGHVGASTNTDNTASTNTESSSGDNAFEKASTESVVKEKNIGMAVIAYILFFVPLLTDTKDDPFVKFHVKQGLLVFVGWVATSFLSSVPVIMFFAWILSLAVFVLMLIGIMNAAGGKRDPLPLVGHYANNFNF